MSNVLESEKIEKLVFNIEKWISYRTVQVSDTDRIVELVEQDIKLLSIIKQLSASNRKRDFRNKVVDYWLAKDIFPDNNIKFDDLRKLHMERLDRILNFLKVT